VLLVPLVPLVLLVFLTGSGATAATPAAPRATVTIDAGRPDGRTNHDLVGFGATRSLLESEQALNALAPLRPRTVRLDVGFESLVSCPSGKIDPAALAGLQERLDAAERVFDQTILILDYMPPCLAATLPGDPRDPALLPPRDPSRWQAIISELVTATGPGRAAAGRRPVRYYELWNEPDFPVFFQGLPTQLVTDVMLPAGRAVGAVAAASGLDLRFGVCGCVVPDPVYMVLLLGTARAAGIWVDFVSWHWYGNHPLLGPDGPEPGLGDESAALQRLLGHRNPLLTPAAFGIQVDLVRLWSRLVLGRSPELIVDEWNVSAGGLDRRHDTHEGAAFQVASLASMARARLDRALLYTGLDPSPPTAPAGSRFGSWGVLDRLAQRKPAWYGFWLWQRLGPVRLASPQFPLGGVWTAAAAADDAVQVLVSSFRERGGSDRSLRLRVAGLAPGEHPVDLYRIDARNPGATSPSAVTTVSVGDDGVGTLETALPAQSVLLAEVRRRVTR
jgi:hypothetical protein